MNTACKILVAEDDDNDAFLLRRILESSGLANRTAFVRDGQEVVDFLETCGRADCPALLLIDLKMPRMNGFDVLRWKQSRPDLKWLPVVVLTSSEQSKDISAAYELGASSYLVKPSSIDDLAGTVRLLKQYWLESNRLPAAD